MSKQIQKLIEKHPNVFQSVSYEGNGRDECGIPFGDGTWLYMEAGWYCSRSDCGSIHEHTIAEVIDCWKHAYQDKQRWDDEHPQACNDEDREKMWRGDYDLVGGKK